jgi:prefoldin subunit 5
MNEQIETRLAELKREYQAGEEQLRELVQREAALRETLLRISGAIQVLEELRAAGEIDKPGTEPEPADRNGADVLTAG